MRSYTNVTRKQRLLKAAFIVFVYDPEAQSGLLFLTAAISVRKFDAVTTSSCTTEVPPTLIQLTPRGETLSPNRRLLEASVWSWLRRICQSEQIVSNGVGHVLTARTQTLLLGKSEHRKRPRVPVVPALPSIARKVSQGR